MDFLAQFMLNPQSANTPQAQVARMVGNTDIGIVDAARIDAKKNFIQNIIGVPEAEAKQTDDNSVDMDKVSFIESTRNPLAHNKKEDARGMFQIRKPVLDEYNQFNKKSYTQDDLFSQDVNTTIADWYMNKRIPQMLKHFKISDTVNNRIWAYNAGIGNVVKGIKPEITSNYLKKYYEPEKKIAGKNK